jgi:hypothetical protein
VTASKIREALLLQKVPDQPDGNVLAGFESSVARQHGIGNEEPSTLNIQEQPKRRSERNVSGDLHSVKIVGSHGFAACGEDIIYCKLTSMAKVLRILL